MTEPLEADIVKATIKALRKLPKTWAIKIHGDMYQERGVPDIVGAHKGRSFVFEAKRPKKRGNVSKFQDKHLKEFRKAGAIAEVITSPMEALEALKHGK